MSYSVLPMQRKFRVLGIGTGAVLSLFASLPAQNLAVRDQLTGAATVVGESAKKVTGGVFVNGGWRANGPTSQIRISLAKPFGPRDKGAVELDITNFDPENQYSAQKQQFFSLISRADGDPSPNDGWDEPDQTHCYAIIRGGTNYIGYGGSSGTGFKSFARSSGVRSEIAHFTSKKDWSKSLVYTLRFEFDESKIRMYLSGSKFRDSGFGNRKENLGYIFVGRDGWEPSTAVVGPVFKEIRVFGAGGEVIVIHSAPRESCIEGLHAEDRLTTNSALSSLDLTGRVVSIIGPKANHSFPLIGRWSRSLRPAIK